MHEVEDRKDISNATGFDKGELFETDEQVHEYFSVEELKDIYGYCELTQDELDEMAEAVIRNRWHYVEEG